MSIPEWLRERTGWDKIWDALFARRIPEAKGWKSWLFTLGSLCIFLLILQIVTGILLAMNYVPSPDHAWDSVRYIESHVVLGGFIRGLHHWGAYFLVVAVFLHLLRVYFMGSYKYPREATWVAGVFLFVIVVGFAFTGYLLPWDQKAYWATVVGTNIAGQTPLAGKYLLEILRGGPNMGPTTLTRFYAFHVLLLPALLIAALAVHLFLVVWHGISEPPRPRRELEAADSEKEPRP